MSSTSAPTIDGVQVFDIEAHRDDRGTLAEVYRRSWLADATESIQVNLSESRAGVLRGLHWHRRQRDYWCFLDGRAFAVFVDVRAGSPTRREVMTLAIDPASRRLGIAIPPGVAHGFYAESDAALLYLVDAYFTGEDEFGLAWDDPELAITWPEPTPVLSERDRRNPTLAEVLEDAPPYPFG